MTFTIRITKVNKHLRFLDEDYWTIVKVNGEHYLAFYSLTLKSAKRRALKIVKNYRPEEAVYQETIEWNPDDESSS